MAIVAHDFGILQGNRVLSCCGGAFSSLDILALKVRRELRRVSIESRRFLLFVLSLRKVYASIAVRSINKGSDWL